MTNEIQFDENLWFIHKGCEGRHYLIGNPHTFYGRILAWCPKKERSFMVSVSEMEQMSDFSKYWIEGYLKGNEPEPPTDSNEDVDFESAEYKTWIEEVKLFNETGYWSSFDRNCEKCGKVLLKSEPEDICEECRK
jgi:hypothetical protein